MILNLSFKSCYCHLSVVFSEENSKKTLETELLVAAKTEIKYSYDIDKGARSNEGLIYRVDSR